MKRIALFLAVSFLFVVVGPQVPLHSQQPQILDSSLTDGFTPPGLEPGTPAHSYALSGLDNISYFNGKLNFRIPLLKVGGRGEAGYSIILPIQTEWSATTMPYFAPGQTCAPNSACPVPSGYTFAPTSESGILGILGVFTPGQLYGRVTTSHTVAESCGFPLVQQTIPSAALTRFTFFEPDGTQHELRDVKTGGVAQAVNYCANQSYNRGRVFQSYDESALRFVADQDVVDTYDDGSPSLFGVAAPLTVVQTGTLYFPDGRAYTIDTYGRVAKIRDRNGNLVTLEYQTTAAGIPTGIKITDPLGRITQVTYGDFRAFLTSPSTFQTTISYPAYNGSTPHQIVINYGLLSSALRDTGSSSTCGDGSTSPPGIHTLNELFPGSFSDLSQCNNPLVLTSVLLPNGQTYQMQYNSYAELARVTLPTGGGFEYDFGSAIAGSTGGVMDFLGGVPTSVQTSAHPYMIYRRVLTRRVYTSMASGPGGRPLESTTVIPLPSSTTQGDTKVTVTMTGADGTARSETHYFYALATTAFGTANTYPDGLAYTSWQEGKEYQTDELDAAGTTVLRSTVHTYVNGTEAAADPPLQIDPGFNPHVTQTDTTLSDTSQVSRSTFSYDGYSNRTDQSDYDFGSSAPGPLLRQHHTDFLTDATYILSDTNPISVYLPRLPSLDKTYLGSTIYAQTQFEYDVTSDGSCLTNPAPSGSCHAPLTSRSAIIGMDSSYASGSVGQRGNVTSVQSYLDTPDAYTTHDVYTYQQYDVAGSLVRKVDARGKPTDFTYASNNLGYAFPTTITNAAGQPATIVYDFNTGKTSSVMDANSNTTSFSYSDPLDRLTSVVHPDSGQTTYSYMDTSNTVGVATLLKSNNDTICITSPGNPALIQSDIVYDGLGRKTFSHQQDPLGMITVETAYDGLGRIFKVSNPYRTSPINYTQTSYDSLDRVSRVLTPDTVAKTTYTYSGNQTSITDPNSHVRTNISDGLGRLTKVIEPNGVQTGYVYDPTGSLRYVNQDGTVTASGGCTGCQSQRQFTYDSLRRLRGALNPETGTITYSYDPAGNLASKVAGGKTSNTAYDSLNRPLAKTYPGNTAFAVNYTYDSATNGVGRLSNLKATDPVSGTIYQTSYDSYDSMGRVLHSTQSIGSSTFPFTYQYNVAGELEQEQYPTGRQVRTCYDTVGRVQTVGNVVNNQATPYATVNGYAPHGAISSVTMGNGLVETTKFDWNGQQELNTRLQPSLITAGPLLTLTYNYCANGGAACLTNNGNVMGQTITYGGVTRSQSFGYDAVDRLTTASETAISGGTGWSQTYVYDNRGNRALLGSSDDPSTGMANVLSVRTPNNTTVPFDTNNRWTAPTAAYDAAGNLTDMQAGDSFHAVYDAENRMVSATATLGSASTTVNYIYDGEGRRVEKRASGGTTGYVYDAMGMLAVEYGAPNPLDPGTIYLTADALGSTRLETTPTQSVVSRSDYMPFGQEVPSSWNGRGGNQSDPGQTIKFTGKERDAETGLDYFGARYLSSAQGRWMSPDWSTRPQPVPYADLTNPQTLNLYGYLQNDPLSHVDADGHSLWRTVFEVYVETKKYISFVGKTNEISKSGTLKALSRLLKNSDVRQGGKRVVVAETEVARDALGKALSANKEIRGPERSGKYAEHINPDTGGFSDVHIETKDAAKAAGLFGALGAILAPFSDAASKSGDSTPSEIGSAALWDTAKAIDPLFITDLIETITGVVPRETAPDKQLNPEKKSNPEKKPN